MCFNAAVMKDAVLKDDPGFDALAARALRSREHAYAPYSGYKVGAALRTADGQVFSGGNVENAAWHGYESTTSVLGGMIAGCGWAEQGEPPVVKSVVYVVPEVSENLMHLPNGASLNQLRMFGTDDTKVSFVTPGGELLQQWDLIALMPQFPRYRGLLQDMDGRRREIEALKEGGGMDPLLHRLFVTRLQAYAPFSHYNVGAAVHAVGGEVFYGCNFEPEQNIGIHAEGMAIARMVDALGPGARIARVDVLVKGMPGVPCGDCRQKIAEFAMSETLIAGLTTTGERREISFRDALPYSFGGRNLEQGRS